MFESLATDDGSGAASVAEARLRALLVERTGGLVMDVVPAPCVVVVDLVARRARESGASESTTAQDVAVPDSAGPDSAGPDIAAPDVAGPDGAAPDGAVGGESLLDPQVRLLEEGAGRLDAVAELERVMARASAAQVRELAAFARCRPSSWDRRAGETGAASAASRAARPAALEPVSEWAAAEVAARLRLPTRTAQARLERAVFLDAELPATLAALAAGDLTCAHAGALVDLLAPVSEPARAAIEAAALERAGTQTVAELRARVRRLIARHDAAAALRRLVTAATGRGVALHGGEDGMATLAAQLPGPLARACYQTLTAYARACEVDEQGNSDPRSLDARRADCLADLILRPHGDRPPVRIDLTVLAGVDTLTGFGPAADEPGEVDGDLVPAPLVRELAHTLGLLPRPGTVSGPAESCDIGVDDAGSVEDASSVDDAGCAAGADDAASVDWSQTVPVPGDAATEDRIARLRAAEATAAADLAAAIAAQDRLADRGAAASAGPDLPTALATARARRQEALQRLLAARTLTGTALAHRPRIALVDQLTGTLLALTDAAELRQAATAGHPLGPPAATEAYRPTDPLTRFVKLRDRRCRFPGCRARARCADLDHQTPHPHGPTAHDNLACLCEFHHRLSHQAPGWRLHRDDTGGLVWTLPGGHTLTTHPPDLITDDTPTTTSTPPPPERTRPRQPRNAILDALRTWHPDTTPPDPDIPF